VLSGVPFVHLAQHLITLVHGQHRPFGKNVELGIGDDGGDFDNAIGVRIQAGHFQINPDQVVTLAVHCSPVRLAEMSQSFSAAS